MKKQFVCLKVCFRVCFQVAATAAAEPRRVSATQFFDKVRRPKLEFFLKKYFFLGSDPAPRAEKRQVGGDGQQVGIKKRPLGSQWSFLSH
jgi:hypothetical protein